MLSAKPKDQKSDSRERLIIGCGHSHWCRFTHPKTDFVTLDIRPEMGPDIVCNLDYLDDFDKELKKLGLQKFSTIVFEGAPTFNLHKMHEYMKYLKESGHLIIIMNIELLLMDIASRHINDFHKDEKLYFLIEANGRCKTIIIPNKSGAVALDSITHKYLNQSGSKIIAINITEEVKKRLSVLDSYTKQYPSNLYSFILDSLIDYQQFPESKLTVNSLKAISSEYKPGFFREHISGMTQGMKELNDFLATFKDGNYTPNQAELETILKIIEARLFRINRSWNWTRNPDGATNTLFHRVGAKVLRAITDIKFEAQLKPSTPSLKTA